MFNFNFHCSERFALTSVYIPDVDIAYQIHWDCVASGDVFFSSVRVYE